MKRRAARAPATPAAEAPTPRLNPRLLAVGAVGCMLLAALLAWFSRGNLNADGVAYLDLADRLRLGDFGGFVQGYWSPAYPALLAVLLALAGVGGHDAAMLAHLLNFFIAAATIALIWRAARRWHGPLWGVLMLTTYLVASARTIRIDAVTPDLLLLLAATGIGLELLRPDGWRGTAMGLWAGFAFLAKTSSWPWLLATALLLGWSAWRDPARRRPLQRAVTLAALPILLWSAAMSIDAGRFTIGSAARLNACWYLQECDGRSPDTHRGEHAHYTNWLIASDARARVAIFDALQWTYAPWGDPTAWQHGVLAQEQREVSVGGVLAHATTQLGRVLGLWVMPVLVMVILPALLLVRGKPRIDRSVLESPAGIAMSIGMVGVLQFVAVHAEPRLIAPSVLLLTLGVVTWRMQGAPRGALAPVALVALLVALGIGTWHLRDQARVTASSASRVARLEQQMPPHAAPHRVAVIGQAFPMLPDLYRARAVVVAQVMAPEIGELERWSPAASTALVERLQQTGAELFWISRGRDEYSIVRPQPR